MSRSVFLHVGIRVFCLLLPNLLGAQFSDDFSDENLTENPAWQGNTDHFIVNGSKELQLFSPAAGTSILYTGIDLADSAVWEFYFRLDFEPSQANRLRIYLQSDTSDFYVANGYFVEIGENGSNDAIRFFRSDDGATNLLATGKTAGVAAIPALARVRITRSAEGLWTLKTDYTGNRNFQIEAIFTDLTYPPGTALFGIDCLYTATRRDKFFFDDLVVMPLLPDTIPPRLLSANPLSSGSLLLQFDESLDSSIAVQPDHYAVDGGIGVPVSAILTGRDSTTVRLEFSKTFENQRLYTVTVTGIPDRVGNTPIAAQSTTFTFIDVREAEALDVIINEILADPTPSIGLPEAEYLELYNRSDKVIALRSLAIDDNGNQIFFPDSLLFPGEYVIVCDDGVQVFFLPYGKTVALPSFPALTNTGEEATLISRTGMVIHNVAYSDSWYSDAAKRNGGWSLEMINPSAPCEGASNWRASEHLSGGTPGRANSVLQEQPDESLPDLLSAFPLSPTEVRLNFSESLLPDAAADVRQYAFSPPVSIATATPVSPGYREVRLLLSAPLQSGIYYEITVGAGVTDCAGNPIGLFDRRTIALPELVEPGDLVIHEVLFNPATGGSDFVELYNRSGKVLNIRDLQIGNLTTDQTNITTVQKDQLIFPGDHPVFTVSPADIMQRYPVTHPSLLIEQALPSLADDEGNVSLLRKGIFDPVVLDVLDYREDWHHPLLEDVNGVSLERLDSGVPTQDRNNWHSASATAGYATPTARNSQSIAGQASFDDLFFIEKPTFSPDDDGYDDFLLIRYQTDQPGYAVTGRIFDTEGRIIKQLARNELLGTEGFLRWDGDTDAGEKARIGIYIIHLEAFLPNGKKQNFKKTCVVAGKLD